MFLPGDRLVAMFVGGVLASTAVACGGSGGVKVPTRSPSTVDASSTTQVAQMNYSTHNNDRDNDGDHNNDDEGVLEYGQAAHATDWHDAVTTAKSYFAAATAGDGARGCALLAPFLADGVPEEVGRSRGMHGRTCPVVMTKLFRRLHREFALKTRSMKVVAVRVQGDKALTIVDFTAIPEVREIIERRMEGRWRLLALRDGNIE